MKLALLFISLFLVSCTVSNSLPVVYNLPECYITRDSCAGGYDRLNWIGNYWNTQFEDEYGGFSMGLVQCCREPHYLMQGIEPTLYVMKSFCDEVNHTQYSLLV